MKTIFIWLCSILLASVIISPFFWLKFLRQKNGRKYLVISLAVTLLLFWAYIDFIYDLIGNWTAKINADLYYFFYNVVDFTIYVVIFFIIISPFIFTKLNQTKFSLRTLGLDALFSALIFVAIFLYWALVLLPKAFSELHNHF